MRGMGDHSGFCNCVSVCVRALKGKRLELSTPKGKVIWLRKSLWSCAY